MIPLRFLSNATVLRINWNNPITRNMMFCVFPAYGTQNLVNQDRPTSLTNVVRAQTPIGMGRNFTTADTWAYTTANYDMGSSPRTFMVYANPVSSSVDLPLTLHKNGSGGNIQNYLSCNLQNDGSNFRPGAFGIFVYNANTGGKRCVATNAQTFVDGKFHQFTGTWNGGANGVTLYHDAKSVAFTYYFNSGTPDTTVAGNFNLVVAQVFPGMVYSILWSRELQQAEVASMYINPFQILQGPGSPGSSLITSGGISRRMGKMRAGSRGLQQG